MYKFDLLKEKWDVALKFSDSYMLVDPAHPLEWHLGYDINLNLSLLLKSSREPIQVPSTKFVTVHKGLREDHSWTLILVLNDIQYNDIFIKFSSDLIDSTKHIDDNNRAIIFICNRIKQWFEMMEINKAKLMDKSLVRGLFGELQYIKFAIEHGITPIMCIKGWFGPEKGDKDFLFPDIWHEIKATTIDSKLINISSKEQLDHELIGNLHIMYIEDSRADDYNSFSLITLVHAIRESIQENHEILEIFNEKLLRVGYYEDSYFDKDYFCLTHHQIYKVDATFPKLTKDKIPVQIESLKYQLLIHSLIPWKIS